MVVIYFPCFKLGDTIRVRGMAGDVRRWIAARSGTLSQHFRLCAKPPQTARRRRGCWRHRRGSVERQAHQGRGHPPGHQRGDVSAWTHVGICACQHGADCGHAARQVTRCNGASSCDAPLGQVSRKRRTRAHPVHALRRFTHAPTSPSAVSHTTRSHHTLSRPRRSSSSGLISR